MRQLLAIAMVLSSCAGVSEGTVERNAQLTVEPELHGFTGSVWGLLYAPKEGFPGPPAVPLQAAAASAVRVQSGDAHLVFASVPPDVYRLWGFLDVDGNFDPQIDVLAQPGAGDRVAAGVEINVQPGRQQTFAIDVTTAIEDEPPAFRVEGDPSEVVIAETAGAPTPLTLVADTVGDRFEKNRSGFRIGLVDDDANRVPDDLDGDGAPDLWPRAFLQWLPKAGQGDPNTVVLLPMILNPGPFLSELSGDLNKTIVVDRLQFGVLSQGQAITTDDNGKVTTQLVTSAPTGAYQVVLYTRTGQYWRIPNDLAGELPAQAVNFHVDRNGR